MIERRYIPHEEVKKELLQDPEISQEYAALKPCFSLLSALLGGRANITQVEPYGAGRGILNPGANPRPKAARTQRRSAMTEEAKKVERSSKGLVDSLFDSIDDLNEGRITSEHARAVSHTSRTIVSVASLELKQRKFAQEQSRENTELSCLVIGNQGDSG